MNESYNKLVKTLKSIFEMDKADLDFGIYRIMNQKRNDVMHFLEEDLLSQVKDAFADYVTDGQNDLQQELNAAIEQAKQFGAPDPEQTPAVKEIRQKMAASVNIRSVENEVYSHLHTFFSRYYDKGDFISQRRYKNDTYAIPYEGEEVKLYWANHDQYYIKSSEHLRDYAFTVNDGQQTIRLKLVEADTEKDNVKAKSGEERRFVLDEAQPLSIEDGELHIHFHYIPVGKKKQNTLNADAVNVIVAQQDFEEWLELLQQKAPTEKNPNRTLLEKHLNDYTARNSFDYFIHKDLGGFLRRELDFYIKNEVFHLDDIDDAAFEITEQHLRKIKALRTIAHKIIRMLAQLEDFQKKLWLKKKFVVETNYCITVDRLAEHTDLLAQVFENNEQLAEWENLFALDLEKLEQDYGSMDWEEFLAQPEYQYLVMDTKFFDQVFKDKLIATIDDLDEQCDGLLINADNFQSQIFLNATYRKRVQSIYLDPPYNAEASEIIYKNGYKHSSWLTLLSDRLLATKSLINDSAKICVTIDDNELQGLLCLLDQIYGHENHLATTPIRNNPQGRSTVKGFSINHEYGVFYKSPTDKAGPGRLGHTDKQIERYKEIDESGKRYLWENFRKTGTDSHRNDRPKQYYPIYFEGTNIRIPEMEWNNGNKSWNIIDEPTNNESVIWPDDDSGTKRVWKWGKERAIEQLINLKVSPVSSNGLQVFRRNYLNEKGSLPNTWWDKPKYAAGSHGTNLLTNLFGVGHQFDFPKSIYAVEDCLHVCGVSPTSIVLDYFGGSGTTAHSVININRNDNGKRCYILAEMGKHFDDVLIPRIKKVVYSKDWQNGQPIKGSDLGFEGLSHCFKYIRLESYEDTLNNLIINQPTKCQGSVLENRELREDYMLGYWLDVETSDSPSLLNIEQFEDPFNYKLNIGSGSVGATKSVTIDLVETFNYLIGLTVKHIDTVRGFKVVTGTNPQDESVLVLWRKLKEQDNAALEAFMAKQGYNPKDTEYAHIYVNGDHTLEDPHAKVKMTEIEFKRLMFDVQDV